MPIDREPEAASKTVEYAYDDWTIARMAETLGRRDVAATFAKRAGNWRNTFDAKTGFVRARKSDGTFRTPFDPTAINYGTDYTEGNAWQYSLVRAAGPGRAVRARWAATPRRSPSSTRCSTTTTRKLDYSHAEDIAGLIGQYIHGNEPSHHVAYLYDHAGAPWRTQARLKQIVDEPVQAHARRPVGQRRPRPDVGLARVHRARLLPRHAGQPRIRHRPPVRGTRQRSTLPNGKRFTVVADGLSDDNPYVGAVTLNGRPLTAQLPPPRGDHGRRRAALHDAGPAEPHLGKSGSGAAVFDVAPLNPPVLADR